MSERAVARAASMPLARRDLPGFDLALECNASAIRKGLEMLARRLSAQGLDAEETGTVQIVLAEVLNNVLEHAYADNQSAEPVFLRGIWRRDGLHISVRDNGRPMPGGAAPIGKLPILDVQLPDMPESGFGWFLIRDLAKDVSYSRVDGMNLLSFRLAVIPSCPHSG